MSERFLFINPTIMRHFSFQTILVLAICFSTTQITHAQGCSDAGFCTVNSFKPQAAHSDTMPRQQIKIGIAYGKADRSIAAIAPYVEYGLRFNDRWAIAAKLGALSQSGNGVSAFGLSDVFVTANYKASQKISLTAGLKVPFTDGNATNNGLPLPMDYQASLGTLDLLLGLGGAFGTLQWTVAVQQPLTQNKNTYFAGGAKPLPSLIDFQTTNQFKRSGDALVRFAYPLSTSGKLKITPSLLTIYHFANDTYTDNSDKTQTIVGSDGLTVNVNAFLDYPLSANSNLQFSVGFPLKVRTVRPDGLTRSVVGNLEYQFRF